MHLGDSGAMAAKCAISNSLIDDPLICSGDLLLLCKGDNNENYYCCKKCKLQILEDEVAFLWWENEEERFIKNLEAEIAFLRNRGFVPWYVSEARSTADVIILCTSDGSCFPIHSFILGYRSDVFGAMIERVDMRENESKPVLLIEDVRGKSVEAFLKFLYTTEVSNDDMHAHYKELVKLSYLYQVKLLLSTLDKFISREMLSKNRLIESLKIAYLYDLETTKRTAQDIIVEDANNELFEMALDELQVDHPLMASQLSKDITRQFRGRLSIAGRPSSHGLSLF